MQPVTNEYTSECNNSKKSTVRPKVEIQPEAKPPKYNWRQKSKNTAGGQKPKIQPEAKNIKYSRRPEA